MRDTLVYQEYSTNQEYRFEVYRNRNFYEIWVQRKISDDIMGNEWFYYSDLSDGKHCADTIERAIEVGRECLQCLI